MGRRGKTVANLDMERAPGLVCRHAREYADVAPGNGLLKTGHSKLTTNSLRYGEDRQHPTMPEVSIIIPCYNTAATLGDTLASLQAQTCADWEAVCVDDASTDATPDELNAWSKRDERIRWARVEHGGLAATRNRALPHVRSEYVMFLDSDDVARPEAVQTLLSAAHCQGGEVVAAGGYEWISATGEPLSVFRFPAVRNFTVDEFLIADRLSSMALISTSLFRHYPFDESLLACEDWDFWLRLAHAGAKLVTVPRIVFGYRIRAASLGHKADLMYSNGRRVLERWLVHARDCEAVRDALHRWAFACGVLAFASGEPDAINRYTADLPELSPTEGFHTSAAEAVRWAMLFTAGGKTSGHGPAEIEGVANRIRAWLSDGPFADHVARIVDEFRRTPANVGILMNRVLDEVRRRGEVRRVVVYGLGTNGLTLLEKMRSCRGISHLVLSVADDYASESTFEAVALPRVDPREWTNWPEGTLVVVTPNDSSRICRMVEDRGGQCGVDYVALVGV